mmetsp:Transcript_20160/g.63134  ORF Transcript_20160/g.63134 Transcript_20160/m.63134 type:complete len:218 (+) Transcript_20160:118-771(+)
MWCADFLAATSAMRSGSASWRTRSMSAFRFTDFFFASSTRAAPTVRMRRLRIWKCCVVPKVLSRRSSSPSLPRGDLGLGSTAWMRSLLTSFRVAEKSRRRSKCVAPPHCEQLLAARSGSVKVFSKQVLTFRAAAWMGSKLSRLHTVPPTMAVWLQEAMSTRSRVPAEMVTWEPGLTTKCLSSMSWSKVSLMYKGFPMVIWRTNCLSWGGTVCSGTRR